jgi:hypothetical protein
MRSMWASGTYEGQPTLSEVSGGGTLPCGPHPIGRHAGRIWHGVHAAGGTRTGADELQDQDRYWALEAV